MTYERPLGASEADFVRTRIQTLTRALDARGIAWRRQPEALTNLSAHNYIQELRAQLTGEPPTVVTEGEPVPVVEKPEPPPPED